MLLIKTLFTIEKLCFAPKTTQLIIIDNLCTSPCLTFVHFSFVKDEMGCACVLFVIFFCVVAFRPQ